MTLKTLARVAVFAGAAMLMAAAGTAIAQQGAPSAQMMQQLQQVQRQIMQLSQQLSTIQQTTVESNPELADQRDALMSSLDRNMAEAGYDVESSREKIDHLYRQLQGGELSAEQTRDLTEQFRKEQSSFQMAQQRAMQDETIQIELESLNEGVIDAMREQDENTDVLMGQLQAAQQQYQVLMQRAMPQQGLQPPATPGKSG